MSSAAQRPEPTLFGHPTGLYTLFFAEMWERFSYYGMRALLVFYMMKGFLGYGDSEAYTVYGAYTALVYMTPFFGGMLADRVLGARRAVVIGGVLMALGQLLLAVENVWVFFTALALLILGNGFFKPNISTIVGSLYARDRAKRDGGFTIFYMGINLGAAMSPLLCSVVAERFGWKFGFGLAAFGMLAGLAVFVVPGVIARVVILAGAVLAGLALVFLRPSDPLAIGVNVLVAIALVSAAVVSWMAIGRGGLPPEAGAPPPRKQAGATGGMAGFQAEHFVYLGALLAIPVFALLVSGLAPLTESQRSVSIVSGELVKSLEASHSGLEQIAAVVLKEISKPAGLILFVSGLVALVYLVYETIRLAVVPRQRMYVVMILTFFSMLFWAFFEQAGSSVNNFTDRNVNRMSARNVQNTIAASDVGATVVLEPTQWQLGYHNGDQLFTLDKLDALRKDHKRRMDELEKRSQEGGRDGDDKAPQVGALTISWKIAPDNVGMRVAAADDETPAAFYQSVNPIFILVLGLAFTALWGILASRGWEPSTPLKFALGLFQLGLGFGAFWYGARMCDDRGMVALSWLFLGYLFQTTGELCLSPVGLAMLTRLSPARLVSTVMGMWFLATAFSQFLAAIIAQFTSVTHNGGDENVVPPPSQTAAIYGEVFGKIAIAAMISAVICFAMAPLLKKWMHDDHPETA